MYFFLQIFHYYIASYIDELKAKYNISNQNPNYTYVSSNIDSETAPKHNNCNRYIRTKNNK